MAVLVLLNQYDRSTTLAHTLFDSVCRFVEITRWTTAGWGGEANRIIEAAKSVEVGWMAC
jgi:hypothetical protein